MIPTRLTNVAHLLRFLPAALALTLIAPGLHAQAPARPFRLYTSGNSLTEQTVFTPEAPKAFLDFLRAKGYEPTIARDHRGGSTIAKRYEVREELGFANFGHNVEALTNFTWDYVTFQPFGPYDDEMVAVKRYLDLIAKRSPDAVIGLYAQYPNVGGFNDFDTGWESKHIGSKDTRIARSFAQTRDYFDRFYADMRDYMKDQGYKNPLRMIPVGYAMSRLQKRILAGEVPGFHDVRQLHRDNVHLNRIGGWMTSMNFYAVLLQQNPSDFPLLPAWDTDIFIYAPELAKDPAKKEQAIKAITQAVWETVTEMREVTGFPPDKIP